MKYNDENKRWMAKGNIGCTFASLFAKKPESVNWITLSSPATFDIPDDAMIVSLQFPDSNKDSVFNWAIANGFSIEETSPDCIGLRYSINGLVSWVQYFGPDSHVITRQAPIPELMLCVKLPTKYFFKVGFNGILHLAHASIDHLTDKVAAKLWETSYIRTKKKLGHSPFISEAAKTTFIK